MKERDPATLAPGRLLLALIAIAVVHGIFWVSLPATNVHLDALDDLLGLERNPPYIHGRHPFSEPAAWVYWHLAQAGFGLQRSIRAMQVWNGAWLTLGLCALWTLLRALGAAPAWRAAAVLAAGASFPATHLATDPFMYYRPPGLALALAGLACAHAAGRARSKPGWVRWLGTMLLLLLGVGFEPMTAAMLPIAMMFWMGRGERDALTAEGWDTQRARRAKQAAGLLLALLPAVWCAWEILQNKLAGQGDLTNGSLQGLSPKRILDSWIQVQAGPLFSLYGDGPQRVWIPRLRMLLLGMNAALAGGLLWAGMRQRGDVAWRRRAGFWGGLIAALWLVSLWWGGLQPFFFLLPLVLLIIAAGDLGLLAGGVWPKPAAMWPGLALACAGLMGAISLYYYVWPRAQEYPHQRETSAQIAAQFAPGDLMIDVLWGDFALRYFSELEVWGIMNTTAMHAEEEACYRDLAQMIERKHAEGKRAWYQIPENMGWLKESIAVSGMPGYRPLDEGRFKLGERRQAAGRTYAELIGIEVGKP